MTRDDNLVLEDEGAGYLVSVSDIMTGLLFVFIITLVAFVIQFQDASEKKDIVTKILEEKAVQYEDAASQKESERKKLKEKVVHVG